VHPLAVFVVAPKRPLHSLSVFKGLNLRSNCSGTTQALTLLRAVPKPATETYELMSAGVLDGTLMPPESILPFKLIDHSAYATVIPGALTRFWPRAAPSLRSLIHPERCSPAGLPHQDAVYAYKRFALALATTELRSTILRGDPQAKHYGVTTAGEPSHR
jgi:hypothetical protein